MRQLPNVRFNSFQDFENWLRAKIESGEQISYALDFKFKTLDEIMKALRYLATCTKPKQTQHWVCINESYLGAFAQKADELNVLYYFRLDLTPPSPGHLMGILASVTTCYPKSMSIEQQQELQEQFDLIKGIFSED